MCTCSHRFSPDNLLIAHYSGKTDLEDESARHRLKFDDERKYGTIPSRIYLLYLKACGIPTLVVFFTSTFVWQALRVYTDVWLRDWTESKDAADVCVPLNLDAALFQAFNGKKVVADNGDEKRAKTLQFKIILKFRNSKLFMFRDFGAHFFRCSFSICTKSFC